MRRCCAWVDAVCSACRAPRAVPRALVALYRDWKTGRTLQDQDRARIARYEARPQAAEWARFLDLLVQGSGRKRS